LRATNITVLQLITYAYELRDDQLTGAPKWAGTDRFSVTGTPDTVEALHPGLTPKQWEQHHERQHQRMQTLLIERFGLVLRAETKEMQIYGLSIGKAGSKLKPVPEHKGAPTIRNQPGRMQGTAVGAKLLCDALSRIVGRTVADETGLTGSYDFDLTWTPDAQTVDTGAPPIYTAIQEQLGLKLEPKKGQVPVLVIEKLERPTEN
jgi:uncharacterized protein (TIGR03435 family)